MVEAFLALGFIAVIIACFIGLPLLVLMIVAYWKLFKKCGREGWEGIIPLYNVWVLVDITGMVWWTFLIILFGSLIPGIGSLVVLFANFCVNYNLAIKMGKEPIGYAFGLTFIPVVFIPILAFGDATFVDRKVNKYGVIPEDKVNSTVSGNSNADTKQDAGETKSTKKSKFCTNCGAEITGGKFCSKCGHEIH